MNTPDLAHTPELVRSFDGTTIAARSMGAGGGSPLLVVNAIGVNLAPWRRTLIDVARERPILTWDHRGLHESGLPASDRIDAGSHAEDAVAVLDHFGAERVVVAAWSTGTRIALELAYRYPERVSALAMICGAHGTRFSNLIRHLELTAALPTVAGIAKHFASFIQPPFKKLTSRPELAGLVRQSGFVGPTTDIHALVEVLHDMAECDLRMLLTMYEAIAGDAAPEMLQEVQAPALLVAGEHDRFTPRSVMEQAATAIPGARLLVYDRATHYLPIEFPARLSDDLRRFFAELPAAPSQG